MSLHRSLARRCSVCCLCRGKPAGPALTLCPLQALALLCLSRSSESEEETQSGMVC